jgi:hypothetical protein
MLEGVEVVVRDDSAGEGISLFVAPDSLGLALPR